MNKSDSMEREDWMNPCSDCVLRQSDEGCALGCSLLLLWTKRRMDGGKDKV